MYQGFLVSKKLFDDQNKNLRRILYLHCYTLAVHYIGFKPQNSKHHQGGQHRGEEVDKWHQDGVKVAVVVSLVVAGEGDDAPEAETQSEEDLRGRLSPHLGLQHDLQLQRQHKDSWNAVVFVFCILYNYPLFLILVR